MDGGSYGGDPKWAMHPGLKENREKSLLGAVKMHEEWDGKADGRIKVWFGARTPGGSVAYCSSVFLPRTNASEAFHKRSTKRWPNSPALRTSP